MKVEVFCYFCGSSQERTCITLPKTDFGGNTKDSSRWPTVGPVAYRGRYAKTIFAKREMTFQGLWLNAFTTGNPFLGTKLLGFSTGRGSGALKGLRSSVIQKTFWPEISTSVVARADTINGPYTWYKGICYA